MSENIPEWVKGLQPQDYQFIKRLILASGSLKDVAAEYGISYPTVRIRLNRLIEKVKALDSDMPKSKFHAMLQSMVVDGKIDIETARKLLQEFKNSKQTE